MTSLPLLREVTSRCERSNLRWWETRFWAREEIQVRSQTHSSPPSPSAAERFNMPYTYGNRLRYSGQYVLLAAVAVGRATVTKEGRSYVYSIKG
jgi:hypothetical protein